MCHTGWPLRSLSDAPGLRPLFEGRQEQLTEKLDELRGATMPAPTGDLVDLDLRRESR